jgi:hypothetical protein
MKHKTHLFKAIALHKQRRQQFYWLRRGPFATVFVPHSLAPASVGSPVSNTL